MKRKAIKQMTSDVPSKEGKATRKVIEPIRLTNGTDSMVLYDASVTFESPSASFTYWEFDELRKPERKQLTQLVKHGLQKDSVFSVSFKHNGRAYFTVTGGQVLASSDSENSVTEATFVYRHDQIKQLVAYLHGCATGAIQYDTDFD